MLVHCCCTESGSIECAGIHLVEYGDIQYHRAGYYSFPQSVKRQQRGPEAPERHGKLSAIHMARQQLRIGHRLRILRRAGERGMPDSINREEKPDENWQRLVAEQAQANAERIREPG